MACHLSCIMEIMNLLGILNTLLIQNFISWIVYKYTVNVGSLSIPFSQSNVHSHTVHSLYLIVSITNHFVHNASTRSLLFIKRYYILNPKPTKQFWMHNTGRWTSSTFPAPVNMYKVKNLVKSDKEASLLWTTAWIRYHVGNYLHL